MRFIYLDRVDKWAPCLWIGNRAFAFGRSNAGTDRWPVFFQTFGSTDEQWKLLIPPEKK